jgi:hypothetical protein
MKTTLQRLLIPLLLAAALDLHAQQVPWRDRLYGAMPSMGRHNWIVVADPAFPLFNSPGLEVMVTGMSQADLLTEVVDLLSRTKHVRPIYYMDSELPLVPERDADGIGAYRAQIATLLKNNVSSAPDDELMAKIEDAARDYQVLVLKSNTMLPYTTVYIELDTGYWSADAERRLRAGMDGK